VPAQRDPLSIRYDGAVHALLIRAIRSSRDRKGVQAWVTSTRAELRKPDAGGRTRHERAFTRSAYYQVFRLPLNLGRPPDWSLKLTWGGDDELRPSSAGRLARPVRVRVYPRAQARVSGAKWTEDPSLQSGGIGSKKKRF
jgi:hypothetical protein